MQEAHICAIEALSPFLRSLEKKMKDGVCTYSDEQVSEDSLAREQKRKKKTIKPTN